MDLKLIEVCITLECKLNKLPNLIQPDFAGLVDPKNLVSNTYGSCCHHREPPVFLLKYIKPFEKKLDASFYQCPEVRILRDDAASSKLHNLGLQIQNVHSPLTPL
jgi:hypothetical protein